MKRTREPVTIRIRATAQQRDLIDQAAARLGRRRSEFMLDSTCRQAAEVVLDQTDFALDAQRFAELRAMLETPAAPTDELRRTLRARGPWDKSDAIGRLLAIAPALEAAGAQPMSEDAINAEIRAVRVERRKRQASGKSVTKDAG
jgi:uncharacterized protein (DUF1778 family)